MKTTEKSNVMTDGLILAGMGWLAKMFAPYIGVNPLLYVSLMGGGIAIFFYGISTNKEDKFSKFWGGIHMLNAKGVEPELQRKIRTDYGHDYYFTLPAGLSIADFEANKLALEQYLDAKIKFEYKNKEIIAKALEKKICAYYPFELIKLDKLQVVMGYSPKGLIKISAKQHMLICGASGFGKSTLERAMLVSLIKNNKPSSLIINLVDFKRSELGLFKYSKYISKFCVQKSELQALLERLEQIAQHRYEDFENCGVLDIEKYNGKYAKKYPYIINFIDEIAQLEGDKSIMSMLQKRISFDRAAGIFYIICTQRPSVDLIPGSVKANIDTRICFKTVDSTNSWIVLDDKEAAQYLSRPGLGLIRTAGNDLEEFQAMYISEDETTEYIKHTFKGGNKQ